MRKHSLPQIRTEHNIVGLRFKISSLKGFEHIAHYVLHITDKGDILEQGIGIWLLGPAKVPRFTFLSDDDDPREAQGV